MTVSGVHAASCLAASEKPASDKHGLRHATSTREVGLDNGGTGAARGEGKGWSSSIPDASMPEVSMHPYYVIVSMR